MQNKPKKKTEEFQVNGNFNTFRIQLGEEEGSQVETKSLNSKLN